MLLFWLKQGTRARQKEWAADLAARVKTIVPPPLEVVTAGWMAGCEPWFQFSHLEWVEIRFNFDSGAWWSMRYYSDDPPTDEQIRRDCQKLLGGVAGITVNYTL